MKKVIGTYANALIAVCIALGLLGVFRSLTFQNGLHWKEYFREQISEILKDASDSEESASAFDSYRHTNPLVFSIADCDTDFFTMGRTVLISSILQAVDNSGELMDVHILRCLDEQFQETDKIKIVKDTGLRFYWDGIYWLEVSALDKNGKTHQALIKIYVNERH